VTRALFAVPVLLLAGSIEPAAVPPSPPADPLPVAAAATQNLPPVTPAYQAAAVAVRRHDFLGALQALERESQRDDAAGRHARLVAGLYAHSLELPESTARLLGEEPTVPGPLEDWRLWVLADARAATGDAALGLAALDRLLADWPRSLLWPRAVVRAVELARTAGRADRAVALIDLARSRPLPPELAEKLERLAYALGIENGREDVAAAAATRLLTEYPLAANELGVPDRYSVARLPPALQLRRAESLLARGLASEARAMLGVVPAGERGLDWHLQMARVLTASNRGDEAMRLLLPLSPSAPAEAAHVAWARGQAALDQSEARPIGRVQPTGKSKAAKRAAAARQKAKERAAAAERERALRVALGYFDEAARLGEQHPEALAVAIRALRARFAEHASREQVEPALDDLRRLHAIAPDDETGVPFLWERGWREYRARNYTGALGFWAELVADTPRERYPRQARYWSARALEQLGQKERARALYAELAAADTTDFYRRHAVVRLGDEAAHAATASFSPPPEPWPTDRRLLRARYLSDIGLDGLAATELALAGDSVEPSVDRRALAALQGIVLARQGRPRPSMDQLRKAFPALGTPLQAAVPVAALELYYPLHYRDSVERWAAARNLPVPLVLGVIRQESAFDLQATSSVGARGLMQLMPGTARDVAAKLGVDFAADKLYDPDYSLRLGTAYFAHVLDMFDGNVELALAGYNSGPYRLKRQWNESRQREVDTFIEGLQLEEPKTYVRRILLLSDSYSRLYPELAATS
jgi:soluble lytic murein transglycosylase-like protein